VGESNRYTISGVCFFCEHILFQIYGSLPRIHVTVYVYRRLFQKLTQHAGLYTRIPYSSADVDNESFMMHSLNFPRVLLAPRIGRTTRSERVAKIVCIWTCTCHQMPTILQSCHVSFGSMVGAMNMVLAMNTMPQSWWLIGGLKYVSFLFALFSPSYLGW